MGKVMFISLKDETSPKPAFAKEIVPPLLDSFSEKRGVKEDAAPDENQNDNQKENKEELTTEERIDSHKMLP